MDYGEVIEERSTIFYEHSWLTLSDDQFISFDNKSFLASPEADIESVHLVVGDGLKHKKHTVCTAIPEGCFQIQRIWDLLFFFLYVLTKISPCDKPTENPGLETPS